MKILPYALPVAAALLIVAFYSALPALKSCALPRPSRRHSRRMARLDWLLLDLLTLLYAFAAIWNLGNTASPESFVQMEGREAVLTLDEAQNLVGLQLFCGVSTGTYEIEVSGDGESFTPLTSFEQNYVAVLKWNSVSLADAPQPLRAVRLRCVSGSPFLGELALRGEENALLPLRSDIPALCDEQAAVPLVSSYRNSTYFDEIYHARTAWEHLHGVWPYEISHPPLGKEILSLGILLFGMNPFGWRIMGTLFGVAMLPVMYLLLKRLFGGTGVPALGASLLATDFMHFTQTRIATIDSYGVFFILLMFYFLLLWTEEERPWQLALCGLSFGLGAASKWICLYAGLGLAVLWLLHWIERIAEEPRGALRRLPGHIALCLLVFVLVPGLIYYLSYLPYGAALGQKPFTAAYTKTVWDNQGFMLRYHAGIVAEHPYSSRWYQWLLDIRPILYYLEYLPGSRRESICAFLNPLLCWAGLLSLFVLGYLAFFRHDQRARFLLIGYLAQLLPWVFISRLTFAYHYFAASMFLVLALGYVFALLRENRSRWLWLCAPFAAASAVLFVMYYPVLSAAPYSDSYSAAFLRWLPTWPI